MTFIVTWEMMFWFGFNVFIVGFLLGRMTRDYKAWKQRQKKGEEK